MHSGGNRGDGHLTSELNQHHVDSLDPSPLQVYQHIKAAFSNDDVKYGQYGVRGRVMVTNPICGLILDLELSLRP